MFQTASYGYEPDSTGIIRGLSTARWLNLLGSQLRISPEYFRRHLDFLEPKNYYDLPAPQSSLRDIVHIKITTICTREVPITQQQIEHERREEREVIVKHQQQLAQHGKLGDSIVRRFAIHNKTVFTLQQNISCCVEKYNMDGRVCFLVKDMIHAAQELMIDQGLYGLMSAKTYMREPRAHGLLNSPTGAQRVTPAALSSSII